MMIASWANAATTVWTGSSAGGDFNNNANWSALAPGNTDPATDLGIFNNGTNVNGTITFSADATHFRTFVQNNAGVISFDVGTHKWTMSSFFLVGVAGGANAPTMRVIGGEVQSDRILLGGEVTNTNPSIELTGSTTHWHLTFGSAGPQVGLGGTGSSILVHNGASMTGVGQAIVGLVGSDNGSLTVDGVGSSISFGNYIAAGHTAGNGTDATNNKVEVLNGASATGSNLYMAITTGAPDNLIHVSGNGSKMTLTGVAGNDGQESRIGWAAPRNVLRIDNGGAVLGTNYFLIGSDATSNTGNQIVFDNGSLKGTGIEARRGGVTVTKGSIDLIQYFDEGALIYKGGGIVANNGADSSFGFNSGTVGSVNADINNGLPFTVGDGGADSATYTMKKNNSGNNAVHSFANGLFLNSNGVLAGNGNIVGNVSGAVGAQVNVGASPGLINTTGAWNNTSLAIGMEVGNLAMLPAQAGVGYDLLDVTGAFTHGGSVAINVAGYAPGSGFVKDLKLIGWDSEVGNSAATAVSFLGGPALPYAFRPDGLYLTNVSFSFIPEPTTIAMFVIGLILCGVGRRRTTR